MRPAAHVLSWCCIFQKKYKHFPYIGDIKNRKQKQHKRCEEEHKMEKKLMNKMEDMELENVAGGTHGEMVELHSAITPNPSGLGTYIPGLSEITKQSIIQKLKDKYGIEAHIDIGWLGLGIASENNTYKDIKTGKSLTHSEVMKRLGK
jgi:hypothetical protein